MQRHQLPHQRQADAHACRTQIVGRRALHKRLKDVRLEALREGFHDCWERKLWDNIVQVGSRIPDELLYEDEKLYMYFEIAQGMAGKMDKGTLFG